MSTPSSSAIRCSSAPTAPMPRLASPMGKTGATVRRRARRSRATGWSATSILRAAPSRTVSARSSKTSSPTTGRPTRLPRRPRSSNSSAPTPMSPRWSDVGAGGRSDDGDTGFENYVAAEISLADHLERQLTLAVTDPMRRLIGQFLIDLVDETGYIAGSLEDVATRLSAEIGEVEAVLAILQGFEPTGVCARSLRECLAIQLRDVDRCDPAMAEAARPAGSLGPRRSSGAAPPLRRRRGGPGRDDRRDPRPDAEARARLRLDPDPARCARRDVAPRAGRKLDRRAQPGHAAARPGEPDLLRQGVAHGPQRHRHAAFSPRPCRPPTG